jgi:hypothetical protein
MAHAYAQLAGSNAQVSNVAKTKNTSSMRGQREYALREREREGDFNQGLSKCCCSSNISQQHGSKLSI